MQRVSRRGSLQRYCRHPALNALIWVNGTGCQAGCVAAPAS